MPKGHTMFQVNNHTANRVVKLILSSPAHGMLSDRLLILTVTGRRTGKKRTFPVAYQQDGDKLSLHIDWPERKVWWCNLIGGAPVSVRLRNQVRHGHGVTHGDANLAPYADELRAFHGAMAAAIAGRPQPLSWQQMLSSGLGDLAGKYQFVLAKPRLDYHSLQPGGAATAAIRAAAATLPAL